MIYTVNYTKKNSFMKDPYLRTFKDGELTSEKKYVKPTLPKSVRLYVPKQDRKSKFVINMTQKELNELVAKIGFYDDNGQVITEAPLNNPNAPFWRHKELRVYLNGSGTTFNDDVPLDLFWLKCFEADPYIKFYGDKLSPSMESRIQYTVTKVSQDISDQAEENDETYQAMKLLTANEDNYEKLSNVLKAMGTKVRNPNPKLVRDALLRKITSHKDGYTRGSSERNIETFIRLMKTSTKDLEVDTLISDARQRKLISKNTKGFYAYGDLALGRTLTQVREYLDNEDNVDIFNEIVEKLKF